MSFHLAAEPSKIRLLFSSVIMSGLEALGLVCNIIQLVEFGGTTISLCRQIHENGKPDLNVADLSESLSGASNSLKKTLTKRHGTSSPDDLALQETADKCVKIADALHLEMQSLSVPPGKKGMRSSIRFGFKTLWRKNHLEKLEKDLKNIQSAMDTQLLVRTLDRIDVSTAESQSSLQQLQRLLQETLRQSSTRHADLSNLVVKEAQKQQQELLNAIAKAQTQTEASLTASLSKYHQSIDQHLATTAKQAQLQQTDFREWKDETAQAAAYQRLLQSLRYESMNDRMNNISETFPSTYSWIFKSDAGDNQASDVHDGPSEASSSRCLGFSSDEFSSSCKIGSELDSTRNSSDSDFQAEDVRWSSFSAWLASSNPVYWISGKPGSGKSTLMKFIATSPGTLAGLKKMRRDVQIYSHYFWNSGAPMQRNLKGLICSLLYQIFLRNQPLALATLRANPQTCDKVSTADWDLAQLRGLLISQVEKLTGLICFFIDGIDECTPQDDVHDFFSLRKDLQTTHVKFCLSSRPDESLRQYLDCYPTLKMHHLTRLDMIKYARGIFIRALLPENEYSRTEDLILEIVRRANGVFLWVVLVLRSVIGGIRKHDSHDELMQRVALLPNDLMGLYMNMWERSNEDRTLYKEASSWYLGLLVLGTVTEDEEEDPFSETTLKFERDSYMSLLELMVATEKPFLERYLNQNSCPSNREVESLCIRTMEVVSIRSAGLLEVSGKEKLKSHPRELRYLDEVKVRFVHRTARDFLLDTENGRSLWQTPGVSPADIYARILKACILRAQLLRNHQDFSWRIRSRLEPFLTSTAQTQDADSRQEEELLESIKTAFLKQTLILKPRAPEIKSTEVEFFRLAGTMGFSSYVIKCLGIMKQADAHRAQAMAAQILLACSVNLNTGIGSSGHPWLLRVWSGQHQLRRHLLMTGVNPNPVPQDLSPPTDKAVDGRATENIRSPWLQFLHSVIRYLDLILHQDDFWGGRISDDIVETMRLYLRSEAALPICRHLLIRLELSNSSFRWMPLELWNSSQVNRVIYVVNTSWLVRAILSCLRHRTDGASIGHEGTPSFARAVEINIDFTDSEATAESRTIERLEDSEQLLFPLHEFYMIHKGRREWAKQAAKKLWDTCYEIECRLAACSDGPSRKLKEETEGFTQVVTRPHERFDAPGPQGRALVEELIKTETPIEKYGPVSPHPIGRTTTEE